ncbi:MAG: FG-GAP-like repeat-containing protein, partial [Woeseiaceae bacterium]
ISWTSDRDGTLGSGGTINVSNLTVGGHTITAAVTDSDGASASDSINIRINNTPPVLDPIGDQSVDEGSLLSFTATASDADVPADTLTFTLAGAPGGASITSAGSFSWTPTEAQGPGSYQITIRVADSGTPTLSDSETITVTVNEINEAPTANDDNFDVTEGGSTVPGLNVLSNDTDPDESSPDLTAELITGPTLDPAFTLNANGTFSYTHDGSETPSDSFTYRACDDGTPSLCSLPATATLTVDAVNDAPVIESQLLPLTTSEETSLLITLSDLVVTDVDSDPATFVLAVQDGTNYTRLDNTITPDVNFEGDLAVPVTVSDGEDTSDVFVLTVSVTGINDAPTIIGQDPLSTSEDTPLEIVITNLAVSDPDSTFPDAFTLALLPGDNYTLVGNTLTPGLNFSGVLTVPAQVNDGELDSTAFPLQVTVVAENDIPLLETEILDQQAIENQPFVLDISANFADVDGDPLTFTASGLPASGNIILDPVTGAFSGVPDFGDTRDNDPYLVAVTATDPSAESVSDIFALTISALDRANVSIDIAVAPEPAMPGDEQQWSFTARNAGPAPAPGVVLSGQFFGDSLSVSIPAATVGCTVSPTVAQATDFECTLSDLSANASETVIIAAIAPSPGEVSVSATAAVTAQVPIDPNTDDNAKQMSLAVAAEFSNGAVQTLGDSSALSMAAGDVDGDGIVDLVVGTVAGRPVEIYRGSGNRTFIETPILVPDVSANTGIALADINQDLTLDLVVVSDAGTADLVYVNDGQGNFSLLTSLGATNAHGVVVADFNLDGNADIAVATTQANPVYAGDGSGGFSLLTSLGSASSRDVAVADLNGDARPDLVFANVGSPSQVWFNDNGSGFVSSAGGSAGPQKVSVPLSIGDAVAVVAADLDNSGSIDLAFGRVPAAPGDLPANPVFTNDGTGNFSQIALLGASATTGIFAGDVNEDGFVDLLFVNATGVHQVWRGSGTGYSLYDEQILALGTAVGILAELGNDGGLDLAIGGPGLSGADLYLNDGFGNLGRGDAVPPVLSLIGDASVEVPSGSTYADVGANAEDNIDGDISASIVVNNPVNTAIVGDYVVTYNVVDSAGNAATPITRTVTVLPATGTGGGGGGGAASWLFFLLLVLAAGPTATHARYAIIAADDQE